MTKDELDAVSKKIIGAAYKVSNSLKADQGNAVD